MAKLAAMLDDKPKVGRVDCTHDLEACDLLVNHIPKSNRTYPYTLMLTTKKGAFIYNKEINADNIYTEFIKAKRYEKFEKHGGMTTQTLINKGKMYVSERIQIMEAEKLAE